MTRERKRSWSEREREVGLREKERLEQERKRGWSEREREVGAREKERLVPKTDQNFALFDDQVSEN